MSSRGDARVRKWPCCFVSVSRSSISAPPQARQRPEDPPRHRQPPGELGDPFVTERRTWGPCHALRCHLRRVSVMRNRWQSAPHPRRDPIATALRTALPGHRAAARLARGASFARARREFGRNVRFARTTRSGPSRRCLSWPRRRRSTSCSSVRPTAGFGQIHAKYDVKRSVVHDNRPASGRSACAGGRTQSTQLPVPRRLASAPFRLAGGDIFHENKPSRDTMVKAIQILRKYTLGDRPVSFRVLNNAARPFQARDLL